ncbi:MAG TPA: hypothetical protein VHB50_14780 [Bryobacteraceae bacterium]|nr:hypothetical protein [Bryobacteraceae bacterium]
MLPNQLTAENFNAYPPEAKALAAGQIELLRQLPLAFVPLLLRELIVYDWKFPAERRDLDKQFRYLSNLSPDQFRAAMASFAGLKLSTALERTDWVNSPAIFSEQLSAHLWATHQIDAFRAAAVDYVQKANGSSPDEALPAQRLGIAIIGQGVATNEYRLFRKLRPHGVYYTQVNHSHGVNTLLDVLTQRAKSHPEPYNHWYIDGGASLPVGSDSISRISYSALSGPRATLQSRMQRTYEASVFDPEAFRTMLAQIKPEEVGLNTVGDKVLNRFALSLLTEGSGTQVFATTFVQWAAREALRRAQPLTMLIRFAPRQREKPMNELLAETQRRPELDPQGSLVDADMGAYYTWLNMQRLSGAGKMAFLVWFEDHREAIVIAPGLERGKQSDASVELADLIAKIA